MPHNLPPCFVSSPVYRATGYAHNHPLGIPRIGTVVDLCDGLGWLTGQELIDSPRATFDELLAFHDRDYVEALIEAEETGKVAADIRTKFNLGTFENPVFQGVYERASMSVGGSICAARQPMTGRVAYHPAGGTHHGRPDRASGFCYFNDPVFAILTFLWEGCDRVLYVDYDAHHGDGVQDAFVDDARVHCISIHEHNRWPNTGGVDDRGNGNARNMPVPPGLNDSEFAHLVDTVVSPYAEGMAPDGIVITCGADALAGDPLSKMGLSNVALWSAVERLMRLGVPTVVVGGGGYNPWTVARCWAGLWARLTGQNIPKRLPTDVQSILEALESDLVDEDEIEPEWLTTIADRPNTGNLRPEVVELAETVGQLSSFRP